MLLEHKLHDVWGKLIKAVSVQFCVHYYVLLTLTSEVPVERSLLVMQAAMYMTHAYRSINVCFPHSDDIRIVCVDPWFWWISLPYQHCYLLSICWDHRGTYHVTHLPLTEVLLCWCLQECLGHPQLFEQQLKLIWLVVQFVVLHMCQQWTAERWVSVGLVDEDSENNTFHVSYMQLSDDVSVLLMSGLHPNPIQEEDRSHYSLSLIQLRQRAQQGIQTQDNALCFMERWEFWSTCWICRLLDSLWRQDWRDYVKWTKYTQNATQIDDLTYGPLQHVCSSFLAPDTPLLRLIWRLTERANSLTTFGNISILAVDDHYQLCPVAQSHVFAQVGDAYV